MARVVVTKNYDEVKEAPAACPVQAFRKGPNGEFVIDPNVCIDCGVCQTIAKEGAIMSDDEASAEAVKFNKEKAEEWL
ncbi:MAG TPA: hypothetical protein VLL98_01285 [Rickettsiales bacterium]|nr:hypothetical protein [Rickettsiales bacterium]